MQAIGGPKWVPSWHEYAHEDGESIKTEDISNIIFKIWMWHKDPQQIMVLKSFAFCFARIFLLIHHANGISWSFHLLCDDPPEDLPFQHCRGPHFSTADRMGVHHVAPWMENPKSQIRWNSNGPKKHTLTLFSCDHASPPYNQSIFWLKKWCGKPLRFWIFPIQWLWSV